MTGDSKQAKRLAIVGLGLKIGPSYGPMLKSVSPSRQELIIRWDWSLDGLG